MEKEYTSKDIRDRDVTLLRGMRRYVKSYEHNGLFYLDTLGDPDVVLKTVKLKEKRTAVRSNNSLAIFMGLV